MPPQPSLLSSPLRLDLANECLWRGAQVIPLRPKTFAMLRCLVEHPGQLQTKAALFEAIWPGIAVSDVVLTVCIRELRQALAIMHGRRASSRRCTSAPTATRCSWSA
jgi:DNA-binding winged helix-turn-helix (wHTH) protein